MRFAADEQIDGAMGCRSRSDSRSWGEEDPENTMLER